MAKSLSITVSNDLLRDRRMHRIAHCLQEEGYEVHLLGVQRKDSFALRLKKNYSQNRISPWFKKSALFYLEINIRFFFRLLKLRPSIVYAVDFDTLLANVFYKRLFQRKIIFDAHEYFTEVPELSNQPFKKLVWHNIGRWGIKHCNLCLTVGTQLAKIFEKNIAMVLIPSSMSPITIVKNIQNERQLLSIWETSTRAEDSKIASVQCNMSMEN